jgi:regulator of ribonuclease activity A
MLSSAHPAWQIVKMKHSTCDLCDEFEGLVQVAEPLLGHFGGRQAFCGEIVTLKCPEDNSLVRELVASDGRGKVLVVDGFGSVRRSLLGDQLAAKAVANRWEGIVINGAVRDVAALEELDLGVMALAPIPLKTDKKGVGERGAVVKFAGVTFTPGHYLYADENGLIVAAKRLQPA